MVGTVAYMSPEQAPDGASGRPATCTRRGCCCTSCWPASNPLRGDTPAETLANVAAGASAVPGCAAPGSAGRSCRTHRRRLRSAAGDRPTAADLAVALRDLLESSALSGRTGGDACRGAQGRCYAPDPCSSVLGAPAWRRWPLRSSSARFRPTHRPGSYRCSRSALPSGPSSPGSAWPGCSGPRVPLFNVSFSVGSTYLVCAVAAFLIARARPIVVVWPVCALLLAPLYLTLLAPAGAVLLGRVRGPLTAAWAGAVTFVYLLLARDSAGPFTVFQSRPALAGVLAASGDPLAVASRLLQVLLTPAGLLQMGSGGVWRPCSASPSRRAASSSGSGSGRCVSPASASPTPSCLESCGAFLCAHASAARCGRCGDRDNLAVGVVGRRLAGGA